MPDTQILYKKTARRATWQKKHADFLSFFWFGGHALSSPPGPHRNGVEGETSSQQENPEAACGLHEIPVQIRGDNSSVIRSGWAGTAALRATASPGPAKHVVADDYIPPRAAVATVKAFLTDAGRFSQLHALAPWNRLNVIVGRRRRRRQRCGRDPMGSGFLYSFSQRRRKEDETQKRRRTPFRSPVASLVSLPIPHPP